MNVKALAYGVSSAIVSMTIATVIAEFSATFSELLVDVIGNAWVAKGLIGLAVFGLAYSYFKSQVQDDESGDEIYSAMAITTVCAIVLLIVFMVSGGVA